MSEGSAGEGKGDLVICSHAERCSGCALLSKTYPEQLQHKQRVVEAALTAYDELGDVRASPIEGAASITSYRLRAKLVVQQNRVGLYRARSHEVEDLPDCRVLRPPVARVISALRQALPLSFELHAIDVREVDGGVLVALIVPPTCPEDELERAAASLAERAPESWALP